MTFMLIISNCNTYHRREHLIILVHAPVTFVKFLHLFVEVKAEKGLCL